MYFHSGLLELMTARVVQKSPVAYLRHVTMNEDHQTFRDPRKRVIQYEIPSSYTPTIHGCMCDATVPIGS